MKTKSRKYKEELKVKAEPILNPFWVEDNGLLQLS